MPVVEKVYRLCEWCGCTTLHDLWVKAEVYEGRDGKDINVFKRFYKCTSCEAKTSSI